MRPPAQPTAADQADILLITGLTKELDWFSKVIGVSFERVARQGTSFLRGVHRVGDREVSIVAVRQLEKGLTSAAVTTTKSINDRPVAFRKKHRHARWRLAARGSSAGSTFSTVSEPAASLKNVPTSPQETRRYARREQ